MPAFATAEDLATWLQRDLDAADTATANQALDLASATMQSLTGQHLFVKSNDVATLDGSGTYLLFLPETPVTAVTSITLNGTAVPTADYAWYRHGAIVGVAGWGNKAKSVVVTYSHGYATGTPEYETLRGINLRAAAKAFENPGGAESETIVSYTYRFAAVEAAVREEMDTLTAFRVPVLA
jgi:hypothetical protein